jgi:polynucleotide 5'-kinase involved in rRNA processing
VISPSVWTAPGLVALHDVHEPCLGGPHTHLRSPRACRFVGCPTPAESPKEYVACVTALLDAHRRDAKEAEGAAEGAAEEAAGGSLIVNTCGWVSGLDLTGHDFVGLDLTYDQDVWLGDQGG